MKYNIVAGISQQFFHSVPSDLDLIQTAPSREGIFEVLSKISYAEFPEFVRDILLLIEGHTSIDITDGQGDEKMDILTLTPQGKRCLTQCKHTTNYKDHYNGNELDLMVTACIRKTCNEAIFVTNTDLTPQGKRYVNDDEYTRGWPGDASLCPKVDYWNGLKIWEKIKNNNEIINKWFSGLGQVHGLRSFKFDMTVQKLPYKNNNDDGQILNDLMSVIQTKSWAKEIQKDFAYEVDFNKKLKINLKKWFQFSGSLDINFVLPNEDINFLHQPLYALTVEVIIVDEKHGYSPNKIKKELIDFFAKELLPLTPDDRWWHITCSQIKSNLFLHDIKQPREITLESASTFVKSIMHDAIPEIEYCNLSTKEYSFSITDDDDDSIWINNKTGIQVVQIFEQKTNPVQDYHYQVTHYYKMKELKQHTFQAVEVNDPSFLMRIRNLLPVEWVAIEKDQDALFWAIPPDTTSITIERINKKIQALGLKVLDVEDEAKTKILEGVQVNLAPRFQMVSSLGNLSFPISLNKRIFWLSKDIIIKGLLTLDNRMELLKFKYNFEARKGFEHLSEGQHIIKDYELKRMLFDPLTFRGQKMIDIGIVDKNTFSLNMRFSENKIDSSTRLTNQYINEFLSLEKELERILV